MPGGNRVFELQERYIIIGPGVRTGQHWINQFLACGIFRIPGKTCPWCWVGEELGLNRLPQVIPATTSHGQGRLHGPEIGTFSLMTHVGARTHTCTEEG